MDPVALQTILADLIETWENEVIEFKEARNDYDTDKIGQYFSALANEANLQGKPCGWLVFGVSNKTRAIVGTDYRPQPDRLQSLKLQITQSTEPSITFRGLYALDAPEGRVVMMQVPAAPTGMPIAWKGHYFARSGESLTSLGIDKLDQIRNQTLLTDWSARIVEGASLSDLDPVACQRARDAFAQKYANRFPAAEVASWDLATLLDRARITQGGRITRTALLLLGRPEAAYLLSPHPAQMTWKLEGTERAYEHFGPPFFLATSQLYQRIRNVQVRLLPNNALLPYEISKYDQTVVLEALHNCIAHQDYGRNGRILVTEYPAKLTFENEGAFFEGQPDDYVNNSKTPRRYRNPFLTQAMTELNMIDTMGYGIYRMHSEQRKRYLPMPDFELTDQSVCMTIHGGVVDPAYTQLLMEKADLPLADVLALDRVQKGLVVPEEALTKLKRAKLVEGRRPNLRVSVAIASTTAQRARYIKTRPFDDDHYEKLVIEYLRKFGTATRRDIDELLLNKLSDALSDTQKRYKIGNLLSHLRDTGRIWNAGARAKPEWRLRE